MSLKNMYKHNLVQRFSMVPQQILQAVSVIGFTLSSITLRRFTLGTMCLLLVNITLLTPSVNAQTQADEGSTVQNMISNDFNLPVTLASKNQQTDGKKKTLIFTDNVVIRQGSLEILADRVEADRAQGEGKEIIIASGKPASYKQRLDDGSIVEAKANEIIYTVDSRTISLKGQASIVQNEVQVTGDSIVFDMSREQILASTDPESSGTVKTVLSPGAFSKNNKQEDPKQ